MGINIQSTSNHHLSCLNKNISSIWSEIYMHGIISFINHEENLNTNMSRSVFKVL
jgi:hypothetical protein